LQKKYFEVIQHSYLTSQNYFFFSTLNHFIVRHYWGALSFIISAIPIFTRFGKSRKVSLSSRTKDFVTNRRLLMNTSDAMGKLMSSYRSISELASYTLRIHYFLELLGDLDRKNSPPYCHGNSRYNQSCGQYVPAPEIEFIDVDVFTPSGKLLIKGLTFGPVKKGQNILIVGPKGSGKSAIFRVLRQLWPLHRGKIQLPLSDTSNSSLSPNNIFYIPQKPYFCNGTLREEMIYPHSSRESRATELQLESFLDLLSLRHLMDYGPNFDFKLKWDEVLNYSEQQRLMLTRLLYHKPLYAILDEVSNFD